MDEFASVRKIFEFYWGTVFAVTGVPIAVKGLPNKANFEIKLRNWSQSRFPTPLVVEIAKT